MTAKILDGKKFAEQLRLELKQKIAGFLAQGLRSPHISVILVGENPASKVYVANKHKACEAVGIKASLIHLPDVVTEAKLLETIKKLNQDEKVDGILVQLPLPKHIDAHNIILAIDPSKDIDGFHPANIGLLTLKMPGLRPATPKGVMMMLKHYLGEVTGMNAVVVGASNIVGRPMLLELLNERATVSICHSRTKDLPAITKEADILVAAVGIANFIKGDWVKPGAIVVDVGINRLESGALAGDVAFDEVAKIAAWISPVPGGVGPMTIMGLLDNTIQAFETRHNT